MGLLSASARCFLLRSAAWWFFTRISPSAIQVHIFVMASTDEDHDTLVVHFHATGVSHSSQKRTTGMSGSVHSVIQRRSVVTSTTTAVSKMLGSMDRERSRWHLRDPLGAFASAAFPVEWRVESAPPPESLVGCFIRGVGYLCKSQASANPGAAVGRCKEVAARSLSARRWLRDEPGGRHAMKECCIGLV